MKYSRKRSLLGVKKTRPFFRVGRNTEVPRPQLSVDFFNLQLVWKRKGLEGAKSPVRISQNKISDLLERKQISHEQVLLAAQRVNLQDIKIDQLISRCYPLCLKHSQLLLFSNFRCLFFPLFLGSNMLLLISADQVFNCYVFTNTRFVVDFTIITWT